MPPHKAYNRGLAVPTSRLSRLAHFGGMATGIAGGMLLDGARQFAEGRRPRLSDLLLTPSNAIRVTHKLANLRGAAMKFGQLLSMDAGEFLPPELAEILGQLRADAHHMPHSQLQASLNQQWGKGWQARFEHFGYRPIAAASIGQVHRAKTKDGRDLAIKVQFPGVRASIDSDLNNVASLMRMSGLLPTGLDIAPMLSQAKRQLHEEADYVREADCLSCFAALLADEPEFVVPGLHPDFSTPNILAMSYVEGVPVESLVNAPQAERDRVMTLMIRLLLRELFEFQFMQTDPNFANYRYNPITKQIVLLDFGATRAFSTNIAGGYQNLMCAGLAGDRAASLAAMMDIGLMGETTPKKHQDAILEMFDMAMAPMRHDGIFDFANNEIVTHLRDQGMELAAERDAVHIPPIGTLFLQRKFGGVYLLGSRLKARVDVGALLAPYQ